ncbi:MAG: hypothetical protein AB7I13_00110 [Vicinamibacterales bacterium]
MPGVLGLDLAKTTGVAWIGDESPARARPWETWTIEIGQGAALRGDHLFVFQKQLDEALREWKPKLVVFEEVTFIGKGKAAFRINGMLCALTMVRCESFAIPYRGVPVTTLKKFAGNGGASKDEMKEFARQKLFGRGILSGPFPDLASSDEMDALWTAWYGIDPIQVAA